MSPTKPTFSPLRFVTPGQLGICLVLFFLPWVEVQCGMPNLANMGGGKLGGPGQAPPKISKDDLRYSALFTQSGFEAATGEYTVADPMMRQMIDDTKGKAKMMGGEAKEEEVRAAPMLFLFGGAALAGAVLGLVLPTGRSRKFLLVLCGGLALASAATQAVIGFPITEDVKKNPEVGGGKGGNQDLDGLKPDDIIKTVYKFPFYLALLFSAGALVTAFIEPNAAPGPKRKRDDYDDEAGEAEDDLDFGGDDDRPRKRRDRTDDPQGDE